MNSNKIALLTVIFSILSAVAYASADLSISPNVSTVAYNQNVVVFVDINSPDLVAGPQFSIHFDNTKLQALSIAEGGFLSQGSVSVADFSEINNSAGKATIVLFRNDGTGISGSGHVAAITFKALEENNVSALTLDNVFVGDQNALPIAISSITNGSIQFKTIYPIVINEIMKNPSLVADADGEYVELYNPNAYPVNINGWTIKDNGSNSHTIASGGSLTIVAQGYLVLCSNDNFAANGEVVCDYEYNNFVLDDASDEVILLNDGSHEVDSVAYDSSFPNVDAKSMELADATLDNSQSVNWRDATIPYNAQDKGTPGSENIVLSGPVISNRQINPSPSNEDQSVTVSATITDFVSITNVQLISDFESPGSLQNYPVTQYNGSVYSFTINESLLENQQIVYYGWLAIDSEGYDTSTDFQIFKVQNRAPVLTSDFSTISLEEDSFLSMSVAANFADADEDVMLFTSTKPTDIFAEISLMNPSHMLFLPDPDFVGMRFITFTANDTYGASANSLPVLINVTQVNDAPQFTNVPSGLQTNEETSLTFSVGASDIENDTLTFSVADADFNVSGNQITYKPQVDFTGVKSFMITVSDGDLSAQTNAQITVLGTNDAPGIAIIPTQNAVEETDLALDLALFLSDSDTPLNQLSVSESSPYASVAGQVITFNYPNNKTQDTVTITVSDGLASKNANISVSIANTNDDPILAQPAVQTVGEESLLTLNLVASDPDPTNDTLTYTKNVGFGALNAATGVFTWTPSSSDIGQHTVEFSVTDNHGASTMKSATIVVTSVLQISDVDVTVNGNLTNNVAPNQIIVAKPGDSIQLSITLTNAGTETLFGIENNVTLHTAPLQKASRAVNQLNANANTQGTLTLTVPTIITQGQYALDIQGFAKNQFLVSREAQQTIIIDVQKEVHQITVQNASLSPNNWQCVRDGDLTVIFANTGQFDENVQVNVKNTALGINATASLSILENTQQSLVVLVSAPNTPRGTYTLDVSATYFFGTKTSLSTASLQIGNCAPVLDAIPAQNGLELSPLSFTIHASDYDAGDVLNYASNRSGVSIVKLNNSAAQVSWIPQNTDIGMQSIQLSVTDGTATDTATATVDVENINDIPEITSYFPLNNPIIAEDLGVVQQFNVSAKDIDFDLLSYTWKLDNIVVDNDNKYTFNSNPALVGTHTVFVNVSDGNLSATRTWTLTVTDIPLSNVYDLTHSGSPNAATNVVISNAFGKINFSDATINFGTLVDLDSVVKLQLGAAGINTVNAPMLNRPANITLFQLPFQLTPPVYQNNAFSVSGTTPCSLCNSVVYDPNTQTLQFGVNSMATFFVPVTNSNPVITSGAITQANINELYQYDVQATDSAGDILTYLLTTAPANMSINGASGLITWSPSAFVTEQVVVEVRDDKGGKTTQSFSVTVTEPPKLIISDLDVKVDGETDKDLDDGDKISEEAKPGSEVEFDVEVKNLFDEDTEDIEIEDVEVTITIEDIDDGDELEEEADSFNLKADDEESVKLSFNIPYEVDEDEYDVLIEVEGEDEDGKTHRVEMRLTLEVEKEDHEIKILSASALPAQVSCEKSFAFRTEIVNIGQDDEDDVSLIIASEELSINEEVKGIELDEGSDDNRYVKAFTKTLSKDVKPGTYTIAITSFYDAKESDSENLAITVNACENKTAVQTPPKVEQKPVVVTKPTTPIKTQQKPVVVVQEKGLSTEWDNYTLLVMILLIIFVGLAIFIIGSAIIVLTR